MSLGNSQRKNREVHIYPSQGERGITRRISHDVFANLVGSDRVLGYTIPRSGPAIIIMKPGTTYDNKEKLFVARK